MSNAIKETNYIDTITGELLYTRKDRVQMQFNETGYLFRKDKKSIRVFEDSPIPKDFTWSERGRIELLKYYILGNDQLLVYRSGNSIKPITVKQIEKLLEMSNKQCRNLVNKMRKHNVIKVVKLDDKEFFMFNPLFVFKGSRLTPTVFVAFQEELREVLPRWVVERFLQMASEIK